MIFALLVGRLAPVPDLFRVCFFITADARIGMLPRLLDPVAKLGAVLKRVTPAPRVAMADY